MGQSEREYLLRIGRLPVISVPQSANGLQAHPLPAAASETAFLRAIPGTLVCSASLIQSSGFESGRELPVHSHLNALSTTGTAGAHVVEQAAAEH